MTIKHISAAILLTLGLQLSISAQQIFRVSQFVKHNYIYNPAAAGAADKSTVGAAYRKMWEGIPGGPQTSFVYGDKYFDSKNVGVGMVVYTDKTGPTSRTGGQIDLSYSIDMNNGRRLMFGLAGMFMQYKIDRASFNRYIPNDPLLSGDGTEIKGDAAAGLYYRSNKLNVGFSVQQLMQSKLNFVKTSSNPQGKLYRHYFAGGHYNFKTDESNVLVPNFSLNFVEGLPADLEVGVRLEHKDLLYVGLGYHYNQSFSGAVGVIIKKNFTVGYGYDQYRSPLSVFANGSGAHELSLSYTFGK